MWDGMDRRRFPRVKHPCNIRLKKKDAREVISTFTENVGCGGICVILDRDLGLFSGVGVELDLENGLGWINADGTVVWVVKKDEPPPKKGGSFDTGIEFNSLKEKDHQRVEQMVNNILAQSKEKAA